MADIDARESARQKRIHDYLSEQNKAYMAMTPKDREITSERMYREMIQAHDKNASCILYCRTDGSIVDLAKSGGG